MNTPLAEPSPLSLEQLFELDPLNMTAQNVEDIVRELRAQRERWEAAEGKPKRVAKTKTEVSLADLDKLMEDMK